MVNGVGGGPHIPEQLKNVAKTAQKTFENFKGILPSKSDMKGILEGLTNKATSVDLKNLKNLDKASSFIKMNMSAKRIEQSSDKIKTQAKKTLGKTIASFGEAMAKVAKAFYLSDHVKVNSTIFYTGVSIEGKGKEIKSYGENMSPKPENSGVKQAPNRQENKTSKPVSPKSDTKMNFDMEQAAKDLENGISLKEQQEKRKKE